jgi:hypothetical protein
VTSVVTITERDLSATYVLWISSVCGVIYKGFVNSEPKTRFKRHEQRQMKRKYNSVISLIPKPGCVCVCVCVSERQREGETENEREKLCRHIILT